ncbi:MAG: glycosyltransferase, partial [Planctomycetota bacterium]
ERRPLMERAPGAARGTRGTSAQPPEPMRLLTITSLFPNAVMPTQGIFIHQRMRAVAAKGAQVRVIAPVPFVPPLPVPRAYARWRAVPREEEIGGLRVLHPRYPLIPKVGMALHAWGYARGIAAAARAEAERFRPQLVDVHYLYPDACAAATVARALKLPYVCSARGSDVKLLARFPSIRRRIVRALEGAAAVVAVSHDLAREMRALALTERPVHVIPNGVDPERFRPRPKAEARRDLGLPAAGRIAVCVANLREEHGQSLLVRAMARPGTPPNLRVYLVGDGPDEASLRHLVASLGVDDRVVLAGRVDHDRVALWFSAADVSVLLSDREGCPNVVLESLACGTPCIGSDLPEMREVIPGPPQGRTVSRDPDAVAAALAGAVERPPGEAHGLSVAARTWGDVADEVLACFREALSQEPRSG